MRNASVLKYCAVIYVVAFLSEETYGRHKPQRDPLSVFGNTISFQKKQCADSLKYYTIKGTVTDNFHENLEGVSIKAELDKQTVITCSDSAGFFSLNFFPDTIILKKNIHLTFDRYDLKPLDTIVDISPAGYTDSLTFILYPRYKILLKGRLFAGCSNTPLEDVNIKIRYRDEIKQTKTLSCYTDDENYWNCLYLGIFKTEIVTDDPEDTVYLSFSKTGFKDRTYGLRFADYSGDLLKFRMKYTDTIPDLPSGNLCFKLGYPVSKISGWYLGFSFYGGLRCDWLKRLKPGFELNMASYNRSQNISTLPGTFKSDFDTIYTSFFVGPSFLLYLTRPDIRKFSTYLGSTFSLALSGGEFVIQPFAGMRFFLDMRKSLGLEIRYISYNQIVKNYTFSYNGNARNHNEEIRINRLLIGIGLQINF